MDSICELVNWILGQWEDCSLLDGGSQSNGSGSGPLKVSRLHFQIYLLHLALSSG